MGLTPDRGVSILFAHTHVFFLRELVEKVREFNTPLYLAFVDLRKAYN